MKRISERLVDDAYKKESYQNERMIDGEIFMTTTTQRPEDT